MTVCSQHGQENCELCAATIIEIPDAFANAPTRAKEDTWMWRERGRRKHYRAFHYTYHYKDGRAATALEFAAQYMFGAPATDAVLLVLDHVTCHGGFAQTPKRVAKCRRKGKDRSRRRERHRAARALRDAVATCK